MNFFRDITDSIYNPSYYRSLISRPFSESLTYLVLLVLLFSVLNTVVFSFTFVPMVRSGVQALKSGVLQHYPNELEISIKKGKASTNVKEPYFLKVPSDVATSNEIKKEFPNVKNILVIDTKNDFSLSQFESYQTYCLLNQQNVACYNKNKQIQITSLSTMPDFILNKSGVIDFLRKIEPFIKFIYPILITLLFLGMFIGFLLWYLIYLLFAALLIWLASNIRKVHIGYGKSYQLGMHLVTLLVIINFIIIILNTANIQIHTFFLLPTVLLVVMAFVNIKKQENTTTVTGEQTTTSL